MLAWRSTSDERAERAHTPKNGHSPAAAIGAVLGSICRRRQGEKAQNEGAARAASWDMGWVVEVGSDCCC